MLRIDDPTYALNRELQTGERAFHGPADDPCKRVDAGTAGGAIFFARACRSQSIERTGAEEGHEAERLQPLPGGGDLGAIVEVFDHHHCFAF